MTIASSVPKRSCGTFCGPENRAVLSRIASRNVHLGEFCGSEKRAQIFHIHDINRSIFKTQPALIFRIHDNKPNVSGPPTHRISVFIAESSVYGRLLQNGAFGSVQNTVFGVRKGTRMKEKRVGSQTIPRPLFFPAGQCAACLLGPEPCRVLREPLVLGVRTRLGGLHKKSGSPSGPRTTHQGLTPQLSALLATAPAKGSWERNPFSPRGTARSLARSSASCCFAKASPCNHMREGARPHGHPTSRALHHPLRQYSRPLDTTSTHSSTPLHFLCKACCWAHSSSSAVFFATCSCRMPACARELHLGLLVRPTFLVRNKQSRLNRGARSRTRDYENFVRHYLIASLRAACNEARPRRMQQGSSP